MSLEKTLQIRKRTDQSIVKVCSSCKDELERAYDLSLEAHFWICVNCDTRYYY